MRYGMPAMPTPAAPFEKGRVERIYIDVRTG